MSCWTKAAWMFESEIDIMSRRLCVCVRTSFGRQVSCFLLDIAWVIVQYQMRRSSLQQAKTHFSANKDANCTLFDLDNGDWLQKDSVTVLDSFELVTALGYGPGTVPQEDINTRQFCYVLDMLQRFCDRMRTQPQKFVLYESDALDFCSRISRAVPAENRFDRIEVSNIGDVGYIGLGDVLGNFGPLLKWPSENPNATLITLIMNATHVAEQCRGWEWTSGQVPRQMARVMRYLPFNPITTPGYHPEYVKRFFAKDLVWDNDEMFDYYWRRIVYAKAVAARSGMCERVENKIIDKWPVCNRPEQKKKFLLLLQSGHSGHERYVEWGRED